MQSTWASQAKAETVERAKGRATTKRNLKLEQTPEERAAHPEPLLDKAENELAGRALSLACRDVKALLCRTLIAGT